MNAFEQKIQEITGHDLFSAEIDTIQVNVGLKCNQACVHCHVASSPQRTEIMAWETMGRIVDAARQVDCQFVDITGGAPELNPHFQKFILALREQEITVQVRTNLTVLLEPGMEEIPQFYKNNQIHLVASLPCYLEQNVDKQRGKGAYEKSVKVLTMLNQLGYGANPNLPLNLVYNPIGPVLPPDQGTLEDAYREELKNRFGIRFTNLLTITNMPIGRFFVDLKRQNKGAEYMRLLQDSFNPSTIDGLMCRHQINIDWDGTLYDCDFNLALNIPVNHGAPKNIKDFDPQKLAARKIVTDNHCFGCTAGCGSSCSGSLVK
ncbi:radical SAM/Cys-rich domain protein [bacterium]|nr:radical SAM/Cys-rich domain protein [bacterium]